MSLSEQFLENWNSKRFVAGPQTVLLAVSGGLDSMVMCDLFLKNNMTFAVAHCNFQLRGEEADMDEQLVRDWTKKHQVKFHNTRFDTKRLTEEWKKGTQETARILRYEWFDELLRINGYAKVATAHHADDNAETLLMNLFKGTGIAGLHGIIEVQDRVIRPLLFVQKEALAAYAAANHVPYREDASNESDAYLRNAVRHHIVPAVKKWFPDAVKKINETAKHVAQAEMLYHKAITAEKKKLMEQRGQDYYIPLAKLRKSGPLETLCYELFTPFGFTTGQIPQIIDLFDSESGHYISSSSHRIIKNRDFLILTTIPAETADMVVVEGAPCTIQTANAIFSFAIKNLPFNILPEKNMACIDMQSIDFPLILRRWRTGDYFYPLGMGMKKKKLSRFLIDQKISLPEKEKIWVLESHKRIVWVAGMRLDERFKVAEQSSHILLVQLTEKTDA